MATVSYASSPVPVRDDIQTVHARAWERLARPGTWWSGEQRVAIAAEARHAPACALCRERKAALLPYSVHGDHAGLGVLPQNVVEVIHRVRTDSGRLTQKWQQGVIAEGLSQEQYVETIGVVVTTVAIDTFCRAIGVPLHALPEPVPGEPTRKRPRGAKPGPAWLPWVELEDMTDDEAGLYIPGEPFSNIRRAMSLVPAEVIGFFDIVETQYLPGSAMRDFDREYRAITHPQIELLASRVSAYNGCEY